MTDARRAYATSRVWDVTADPNGGRVTRTPQRTPEVELALPIEEVEVGEFRRYKLTFPFLPPSKNKLDGWPHAWKSSAKRKWEAAVERECERLQVPKGQRRIGLAAVLWFSNNNRRDPSNYSQALWNWIPDGLQKCGVLLDDRDGAIDFAPNLGVQLRYDNRTAVPKAKRERTIIGLTIRMMPDKP